MLKCIHRRNTSLCYFIIWICLGYFIVTEVCLITSSDFSRDSYAYFNWQNWTRISRGNSGRDNYNHPAIGWIINTTRSLYTRWERVSRVWRMPHSVYVIETIPLLLWFYCFQNSKLFSFPFFQFWAYLMKIIPETHYAH